jgi:hypothetical protein
LEVTRQPLLSHLPTTKENDSAFVHEEHAQSRSILSFHWWVYKASHELATYLQTCEFGMVVLLKSKTLLELNSPQ